MLANVAFYGLVATAAVAFLLFFLDFILSDEGKKNVEDGVMRLWLWLAEAKEHSLIDWLRRYERWIWGAGIALVCIYYGATYGDTPVPTSWVDIAYTAVVFSPAALVLLVYFVAVRLTLRAGSLTVTLLSATILLFLSPLPILAFNALGPYVFPPVESMAHPTSLQMLFWGLMYISCQGAVLTLTLLLLLFWAVIAVPITAVHLLNGLLFAGEFVIRRTAEKPNVLLAGGAVFAALAVLLKSLLP